MHDLRNPHHETPEAHEAQLGVLVAEADELITLTEDGHQRAEGAEAAREEWLTRALQERYSDAERDTIIEALGLLDRLSQS